MVGPCFMLHHPLMKFVTGLHGPSCVFSLIPKSCNETHPVTIQVLCFCQPIPNMLYNQSIGIPWTQYVWTSKHVQTISDSSLKSQTTFRYPSKKKCLRKTPGLAIKCDLCIILYPLIWGEHRGQTLGIIIAGSLDHKKKHKYWHFQDL